MTTPEPLEYETPAPPPSPDARPVFRVLAGLLGVVAAVAIPGFLYLLWRLGEWHWAGIAFADFLFAFVTLKLAITGRLAFVKPV